jgi:hypothetical protein
MCRYYGCESNLMVSVCITLCRWTATARLSMPLNDRGISDYPNAKSLFNRCIKDLNVNNAVWYTCQPLAKRTYSGFMTDLCKQAKCHIVKSCNRRSSSLIRHDTRSARYRASKLYVTKSSFRVRNRVPKKRNTIKHVKYTYQCRDTKQFHVFKLCLHHKLANRGTEMKAFELIRPENYSALWKSGLKQMRP